MPVVIRNNTNSIEVDVSVNLKITASKGAFDVIYEDIGDGVPYVYLIIRSNSLTSNSIKLDWRDCSSPDATFTSAENLRDTLIGWNIQKISVNDSVLPSGAATAEKQTELSELIETLCELNARLTVLVGMASHTQPGLRVVGVSMPSTAVTGPITSAQHLANELTKRKAIENLTAIESNINNVSITA